MHCSAQLIRLVSVQVEENIITQPVVVEDAITTLHPVTKRTSSSVSITGERQPQSLSFFRAHSSPCSFNAQRKDWRVPRVGQARDGGWQTMFLILRRPQRSCGQAGAEVGRPGKLGARYGGSPLRKPNLWRPRILVASRMSR